MTGVIRAVAGSAFVALGVTGSMGLAGQAYAAKSADPPGNNGTVKIAELGDFDKIPNNQPHQGCDFKVQWYDFDQGSNIVSKVSFALQAPTLQGRTMSVDGPGSVAVGEDAASGAGNDFDGEQVYRLSFTGAPHPKQGYHVKLTVNTPGSIGADKKSKVFWVLGCETPPPPPPPPPPCDNPYVCKT